MKTILRRDFLKTSGAAAAAFSFNVRTSRKGFAAGREPVVIGSGEHTYECHHNWGALPEGHHYGNASHGAAFDRQGLIYVSHQGTPGSVFVFDAAGKFVKAMFPEHSKGDQSAGGHGIDIRVEADGKEYIYLSPSDSGMAFTKATINGEIVWTKGRADLEKDADMKLERYRPTNVSFAPDGDVFLGDGYGSGFIFRYSSDGGFKDVFGGSGTEEGKFRTPHGQWLDNRDGTPKTVVCDRANARLQWFDMDNQHLKTMDGFLFPADVDIRGNLMVVPDLHARITILDGDNEIVAQLGDDEAWRARVLDKKERMRTRPDQWPDGRWVHPHDAAFDKDGNIFVAEWVATGRVTKLRKVGA